MTKELTPSQQADNLVQWVERSKPGLRRLGIDEERFARVLATEIRSNPKLAQCDPATVMGSMFTAAQLGIEPGGTKGHCWLIPRWNSKRTVNEATFMLGYKGMIDLAYREADIVITLGEVYPGDKFQVRLGDNPGIDHEPGPTHGEDPTQATRWYAVAHMPDGGPKIVRVLTRSQVEHRRQSGSSADSPAWVNHWNAMALKTAARAVWTHIPKGTSLNQADTADETVVAPTELEQATREAASSDGPPDVEHIETFRDTPDDPHAGDHLPAEFVLEVEQLRPDADLVDDAAWSGWLDRFDGAQTLDDLDPDRAAEVLDALRDKAAN